MAQDRADLFLPYARKAFGFLLFEDKKVEDAIDEIFDRKVKREFKIK